MLSLDLGLVLRPLVPTWWSPAPSMLYLYFTHVLCCFGWPVSISSTRCRTKRLTANTGSVPFPFGLVSAPHSVSRGYSMCCPPSLSSCPCISFHWVGFIS